MFLTGAAQLSDREISDLKSGRKDDTSFVYTLPFAPGKGFLLIQGSNSKLSHNNELAYDFKMKRGSKVCAARNGIVTSARSDSEEGGLKQENLSDGNYIIITHKDGSTAYYWHLNKDGVLKSIGDTVLQGELIAYSGNTGYSAFPHLHFQVIDSKGSQILVRFATKNGNRYLRPGRIYRRSNS